MHVVECPNCNAKFKVSRPRVDAKLKCSACGQTFVGSSKVVPDSVAGGAAAAKGPLKAQPLSASEQLAGAVEAMQQTEPEAIRVDHRQRLRPKGKPWMVAVVSAAMVCIVVGLIAAGYLLTHTRVQMDNGSWKWVTNAEAERLREERKAPKAAAQVAPDGGAVPNAGAAGAGGAVRPPTPTVVKAALPPSDSSLSVSEPQIAERVAGGKVYVYGSVRNDYPNGATDVTVHCRLVAADGSAVPGGDRSMAFRAVPTAMSMPFSFDYGNLPDEDLINVTPHVWATGTNNPKAIAWQVQTREMTTDADTIDLEARWTGTVRNPNTREARDVQVFCDFYIPDSGGWLRHVGAVGPVGLVDQKDLSPQRTARFNINFAPKNDIGGMATERRCRVVGR